MSTRTLFHIILYSIENVFDKKIDNDKVFGSMKVTNQHVNVWITVILHT